MLCNYKDITEKLGTPLWWDDYGVPRYCDFEPMAVADIYAKEAALVVVACQNCQRQFPVAITSSAMEMVRGGSTVRDVIESGTTGWGDPPNIGCCASGPTMTSDDVKVLEFWEVDEKSRDWSRVRELEVVFE